MNDRQKLALIKRGADFLEKMSITSLAVGVFQGQEIGIWIGIGCAVACAVATYLMEK